GSADDGGGACQPRRCCCLATVWTTKGTSVSLTCLDNQTIASAPMATLARFAPDGSGGRAGYIAGFDPRTNRTHRVTDTGHHPLITTYCKWQTTGSKSTDWVSEFSQFDHFKVGTDVELRDR